MKKRAFWVISMGILVMGIAWANAAEEDYIMGDIDTLPSDFYLDVRLLEAAAGTIDRLATFQVREVGENASGNLYDISFFKDGTFVRMYPKKTLPFQLKRNFWGVKDGDYRITFVARNEAGKIGKGSLTVRVRHE